MFTSQHMVHFHLIQSEVVLVTVTQEQRDYDSERSGWGVWEPELLSTIYTLLTSQDYTLHFISLLWRTHCNTVSYNIAVHNLNGFDTSPGWF